MKTVNGEIISSSIQIYTLPVDINSSIFWFIKDKLTVMVDEPVASLLNRNEHLYD